MARFTPLPWRAAPPPPPSHDTAHRFSLVAQAVKVVLERKSDSQPLAVICTHLSSGHKEKDVKARFQEVEGPSRTKNRCVQSISALSLNASMYVVHAHCGPATLDCAHPLLHLRAVTTAGRMARRCSSGTRGAPRRCRRSCAWTPTLLPTRSIRSGRFCAAQQPTACGTKCTIRRASRCRRRPSRPTRCVGQTPVGRVRFIPFPLIKHEDVLRCERPRPLSYADRPGEEDGRARVRHGRLHLQ